ncbi:MAG: fasciclin domain-containing protein [Pseudomonadota bacterium]
MSQNNTFTTLRRSAFTAAIALAMVGCATTPTPVNLADSVAGNPSLSTFNTLVAQGGLSETLKSGGPFTVFAPTNEAFKAVPAATMDDLRKHPEKLKDVLSYHVAPGKLMAVDIKNNNTKTLNGATLALAKAGDFVTVENAAVVATDLGATNGVVHTIDTVLVPPKK